MRSPAPQPRAPARPPTSRRAPRRGFTLVEVMIATLLVGIVGTALVAFLTAFARGGEARERISDPAIESSLASRRLDTLLPAFRAVLAADGETALIWTTDRVASRSVHLSEAALVRFDAEAEELLLETASADALAAERELEREYLIGQYGALLSTFDTLRERGLLDREILAEGIEAIELVSVLGTPGVADATFTNPAASARIRIAPASLEEPLR